MKKNCFRDGFPLQPGTWSSQPGAGPHQQVPEPDSPAGNLHGSLPRYLPRQPGGSGCQNDSRSVSYIIDNVNTSSIPSLVFLNTIFFLILYPSQSFQSKTDPRPPFQLLARLNRMFCRTIQTVVALQVADQSAPGTVRFCLVDLSVLSTETRPAYMTVRSRPV